MSVVTAGGSNAVVFPTRRWAWTAGVSSPAHSTLPAATLFPSATSTRTVVLESVVSIPRATRGCKAPAPTGMPRVCSGRDCSIGDGIVLCVGDSFTLGGDYNAALRAKHDGVPLPGSYPAALKELLWAGGMRMQVLSFGYWGMPADDMAEWLPNVLRSAASQGRISCVVILAGANDIMKGYSPARILANLTRLHDIAASVPGAPHVVVLTIPPVPAFRARYSMAFSQGREAVNAGLCVASKGKLLVDLNVGDTTLQQPNGLNAKDGVHFTARGNVELARAVFAGLKARFR